MLKLGCCFHQP